MADQCDSTHLRLVAPSRLTPTERDAWRKLLGDRRADRAAAKTHPPGSSPPPTPWARGVARAAPASLNVPDPPAASGPSPDGEGAKFSDLSRVGAGAATDGRGAGREVPPEPWKPLGEPPGSKRVLLDWGRSVDKLGPEIRRDAFASFYRRCVNFNLKPTGEVQLSTAPGPHSKRRWHPYVQLWTERVAGVDPADISTTLNRLLGDWPEGR